MITRGSLYELETQMTLSESFKYISPEDYNAFTKKS
jgi:hypothetical protein